MRVFPHRKSHPGSGRARGEQALTLIEMMVTMSIFLLVVGAIIYANMFGMKYDELVNSKLGASDASRESFDKLSTEIRSAKIWAVGNGTQTTFTACTNGAAQQGNALQFSFTTNTSAYVRYYFDTTSNQLCRVQLMQSGQSSFDVLAKNLTNIMMFTAEDYAGSVKTNLAYKYVVHFTLQFFQYQYPLTRVGPGYLYDSYKLEFRVTPHCPDGA